MVTQYEDNGSRTAIELMVGPFYDAGGACAILSVSPHKLAELIADRDVLALTTGSGQTVFPAWQFTEAGAVIPHLSNVLEALAAGTADPWSWALWLCSVSDDEWSGLSAWNVLASGLPPDAVLREARRDAARWRH